MWVGPDTGADRALLYVKFKWHLGGSHPEVITDCYRAWLVDHFPP